MMMVVTVRRVPRSLVLAVLLPSLVMLAGCPSVPHPVSYAPVEPGYVARPVARGRLYTIQSGDTLYSVARRHGADWREIVEANPPLDPRDLQPGTVIVIPNGREPDTTSAPTVIPRNPGHSGPIPAERTYIWPVKGKILCRFGRSASWRMWVKNNGLDIRTRPGQVVRAAKSGHVSTFEALPGFGKVVTLEHTDGSLTFYGHNARILVTHGRWVKQGEPIAITGSSGGLSSGTELHFRILRGVKFVDPLRYLP